MSVFRNVVFVAALAGLVAAVVMTALQMFSTVPLILQAEDYEQAADVSGHDHAAFPADQHAGAADMSTTAMASEAAAPAHEHGEGAWEPADGFERYSFTALANIVTGIGFALILVVASEFAGGLASWRQGLLWGLAGFAVFTLAPGLGLPPELPAMPAADLAARQVWWWGTAAATAAGLTLIAFRRALPLAALGVALIVVPHIIGAPQPADFETPIPEGLHHQFVVAVTVTNLVFWVVLGMAAGALRSRFMSGEDLRSSFA
ncbi:CbtA family protein [Mesorhizobium sp. BAC0120]|uniref:CbtA family protein n=1 Tax=Mesorhizobium sp. BAC0120 TaxID=3090670 RepID=UPI00298C78E1|nr:CbtA family protein [Mesorhizobium sp. BAC0120]MDW6020542.1 CbtA family protein [Mesorhizobium sp. BAC0120]